MSRNDFLKADLILVSGNLFSSQWKLLSQRYFSRNSSSWLVETHFSAQMKQYCFLLKKFFPASGNHHLNYREAYLKLLLLLLAAIFFDFPDIPDNINSFFVQQKPILKLHQVYLKQYFFIWRFFSAIVNHRVNTIFGKWRYFCWKLIFRLVESIIFLPFSDTPATDNFISRLVGKYLKTSPTFWLVKVDSLAR